MLCIAHAELQPVPGPQPSSYGRLDATLQQKINRGVLALMRRRSIDKTWFFLEVTNFLLANPA
jgi:hypothetical protein